jgi:hypothetical protein
MLHLREFLTDWTLRADVEARIAGVKWKELADREKKVNPSRENMARNYP